jgi:hypothetical protein
MAHTSTQYGLCSLIACAPRDRLRCTRSSAQQPAQHRHNKKGLNKTPAQILVIMANLGNPRSRHDAFQTSPFCFNRGGAGTHVLFQTMAFYPHRVAQAFMPLFQITALYPHGVEQAFMPAASLSKVSGALAPEVPNCFLSALICANLRLKGLIRVDSRQFAAKFPLPRAFIRLAPPQQSIHFPDLPSLFHPI